MIIWATLWLNATNIESGVLGAPPNNMPLYENTVNQQVMVVAGGEVFMEDQTGTGTRTRTRRRKKRKEME